MLSKGPGSKQVFDTDWLGILCCVVDVVPAGGYSLKEE